MLYQNFCEEQFNEKGHLIKFRLKYKPDFNYGYDVIDVLRRTCPERLAMIYAAECGKEKRFTFGEISVLSSKAANVFLKYGVKKGDRVMVILKNHYEYWYIALALHKIGAVICPVFYMLPVEALLYRLKKADISHVVCTPYGDIPKKLLNAVGKYPLKNLFSVREDVNGFINLTRETENASDKLERIPTLARDPMIIYFTSGTTGLPKAVMHNHLYTISQIVAARYLICSEKGGLHLSVSDTGWAVTSGTKFYGPWIMGVPLLIYEYDSFSPEKMLETMEKYEVNSFMATPTLYKGLIEAGMDKYNLSALDTLSSGGEPLPLKVAQEVFRQTGITLREGLAQSESSLYVANLKFLPVKPGSIGKLLPKFETAIVDESGKPVEQGEFGEIVIIPQESRYQDGIAMGYLGDNEAYENSWRNGVFHTGDFARQDDEGYIFYGGRVDDLIKTKGYRVSPFEIEDVLMRHPAVYECMVQGEPNEKMGQAIKAYVVAEKGFNPDENLKNEMISFANARLAGYMKIRHLEFVKALEKSVNGKIVHKINP